MRRNQAKAGQSFSPSVCCANVGFFSKLKMSMYLPSGGTSQLDNGLQGAAQGLGELDIATAITARAGDGRDRLLLHMINRHGTTIEQGPEWKMA